MVSISTCFSVYILVVGTHGQGLAYVGDPETTNGLSAWDGAAHATGCIRARTRRGHHGPEYPVVARHCRGHWYCPGCIVPGYEANADHANL